MPTYEYRCPACQHEFEKLQKMSDEPGAACPECGAPAERLLSGGAGLIFKGSGFYITDYRSDSYKKAASSEKGSGGEKKSGDKGGSGSSSGTSSTPKSE
jgi:putative FmdB family regulatory protein